MSPILPRFLKPGRLSSRRRSAMWRDGETVAEAAKSTGGDKAEERLRRFAFFRLDWRRPCRADADAPGSSVPADARRTRFFVFAAALGALWLYFLFTPPA